MRDKNLKKSKIRNFNFEMFAESSMVRLDTQGVLIPVFSSRFDKHEISYILAKLEQMTNGVVKFNVGKDGELMYSKYRLHNYAAE